MMASRSAGADHAAEGARLRDRARAFGVELSDGALRDLATFLDELELWNARANLVGQHDRATLIERHLVDSLAAVPLLRGLGENLRVADLGSGAGLPGIPLAIVLQPREMLLVEPRRKRASFLRAVRRKLTGLAIAVHEGRAEEIAPAETGPFDAVVSRAALSETALRAAAAPLVRHGGLLVAYRGDPAQGQDTSADLGREVDGFGVARIYHYELERPSRRFALLVRERICFT